MGCAVPFPLESQSDFGALEDGADGNALTDLADRLGEESSKAEEAKERAREALERGWMADCGSSPYCLRERAAHLAGLADAQNPDYASPEEWTFGAPLLRARRYYAARLGAAALEGRNPEELTDAACRRAFYSFALDEVRRGEYAELDDGMVVADLPALPCNAEQTRAGRLYTDALWPVSREEGGRVLHSWDGCPGALGGVEGAASLHDLEQGAVSRCEVCRMDELLADGQGRGGVDFHRKRLRAPLEARRGGCRRLRGRPRRPGRSGALRTRACRWRGPDVCRGGEAALGEKAEPLPAGRVGVRRRRRTWGVGRHSLRS